MKKILLSLLITLFLVSPVFATTYFAKATGGNIDAADTWSESSTGSCTGGASVAWGTVNASGNILYANGCANVIINVDLTLGAAGKISTVGTSGTAGGGFSVVTATTPITITGDIEAGSTIALTVTGSANDAGDELIIVGDITGGTSANAFGVTDSHTVGNVSVTGNISGGTASLTRGYYTTGATGSVTVTGNVTAATGGVATGAGFQIGAAGTATINGDCIGSTTAVNAGCDSASGSLTITGSIIAGVKSSGANGPVTWLPSSAQKYIKILGAGTAIYASAGMGSDAGGTQIAAADTAAKVSTGTYFVKKDDGVYTQGSASAGGGGGAWAY